MNFLKSVFLLVVLAASSNSGAAECESFKGDFKCTAAGAVQTVFQSFEVAAENSGYILKLPKGAAVPLDGKVTTLGPRQYTGTCSANEVSVVTRLANQESITTLRRIGSSAMSTGFEWAYSKNGSPERIFYCSRF